MKNWSARALSVLALLLCTHVHGQATYIIPQSLVMSNTDLFGAATVTATAQSVIFTDVGNTVHYVTYQCSGTPSTASIFIEGSRTGTAGTYQRFSQIAYNVSGGGLTAYGYLPFLRINATFVGTTVCTFAYSGTSVANAERQGVFSNIGATLLYFQQAATGTINTVIQPPNSRSGGTLFFVWIGNTGCVETVSATSFAAGARNSGPKFLAVPNALATTSATVTLSTSPNLQAVTIPDGQATDLNFVFTGTGGTCGADTFNSWYSSGPPIYGQQVQGGMPSGGTNSAQLYPVKIGCSYNTTPATVTDGQVVDTQCDATGRLITVGSGGGGSTIVVGTLTDNNAAPAAGTQLGVLPAVANAVAPTVIEGDQVLESTDLKRQTRVVLGPPGTADTNASLAPLNSTSQETNHVFCAAACNAFGVFMSNANAADRWLQCFNATSLPANATVPLYVARCVSGFPCSLGFGQYGVRMTTGFTCASSTTQNSLTVAGADALFEGFAK